MNNPFIAAWYGFPSLYFFIQSLSIRLFGQTTEALRITSALAGAQAVNMIIGVGNQEWMKDMAGALYEHELTYLLGWSHTWPDGDGSGPGQFNDGLWFPFTLFG